MAAALGNTGSALLFFSRQALLNNRNSPGLFPEAVSVT